MALSEKKQKLWIWKALCRDTGELIAWECGDRDKATLKKLIGRLEKWSVRGYYTDDYQVYSSVIPAEKLVQTETGHTPNLIYICIFSVNQCIIDLMVVK